MNFTNEIKETVQESAKKIVGAVSALNEWVQDESLSDDMKKKLPELIDSYTKEIKSVTGYEGDPINERIEMQKTVISNIWAENEKLREELLNQSNDYIGETIRLFESKVEKVWQNVGFQHVYEPYICRYGYFHINLSPSIDFSIKHGSTEKGRKSAELIRDPLIQKGLSFTKKFHFYEHVIDNDLNRKIIEETLKGYYPSMMIQSYQTERVMKKKSPEYGSFRMNMIEIVIENLADLEN